MPSCSRFLANDVVRFSLLTTDSVAFEFGPKHGVLIYSYPEDRRPDSKSDILAFGFITVQENAQLIRITSASSNDFLELTLVCPRDTCVIVPSLNIHSVDSRVAF